jgi:hypothetical protein
MVLNVEYNQLDPLLRASGHPDGDVNDPTTGYSPYPGNINQVTACSSLGCFLSVHDIGELYGRSTTIVHL